MDMDLIQCARDRYEELTGQIAVTNPEWAELGAFLAQADKLCAILSSSKSGSSKTNWLPRAPVVANGNGHAPPAPELRSKRVENTSEIAQFVLRHYGPR